MKKRMIWKHITIITMMFVFALVSFDISYSEEGGDTQEQFKVRTKHPEAGVIESKKIFVGGLGDGIRRDMKSDSIDKAGKIGPKKLTPLNSEEDDVEKRQPVDKPDKIRGIEAKKKKREVVLVVGSKVKEVVKDSDCRKDPDCQKDKDKAMTVPLGE